MIIKGGSRRNRRFFARHLMNERDNDRASVVGFRGFAHENVDDAFVDMEAVAKGSACKNFFYHASLNPRENERLTAAQWEQAVDRLERNLGLAGQARIVFEHEKEGRTHRHVVWSRINLDRMTAISDSLTAPIHERTSRELEEQFGLAPVASVLVKDRGAPRPARRPRDWEGFRGSKGGASPDDVKAEVTALWNEAGSGAEFRAALAQRGYLLCKGDRRDFCIIDAQGNDHSLARRIDGARAADVRERMADIDRDGLPTVAQGRSERREDRGRVDKAVAAGADKRKVTAVIDAARAAEAMPLSQEETREREGREESEKPARERRKPTKEPPPEKTRPNWQAREQGKRRERDREPER